MQLFNLRILPKKQKGSECNCSIFELIAELMMGFEELLDILKPEMVPRKFEKAAGQQFVGL